MALLLFSFVSAVDIQAGESYSFDIGKPYAYWSAVGNSSSLEGMEVSQEGTIVTLTFDKMFAPDSFDLIFFDIEKEIIVEHHHSSSGGGTKYVDKEVPVYVDKNVIVKLPGETIEVDKLIEVETIPIWTKVGWGVLVVLLIGLFIAYLKKGDKGNGEG